MSTLSEIAASLQDIAEELAEMDGGAAAPVDPDNPGLSDIFPGFTYAGAPANRRNGKLSLAEGELIRLPFTVAKDAKLFSFGLGVQGSNAGVLMLLHNGFRLRVTTPDGSAVTNWGPRAAMTAEPVRRRLPAFLGNWSRPGAQGSGRPQVGRGDDYILEVMAGEPTGEDPVQTFSVHYLPTN